jgi:hypothetical protein
MPFSGIPGQLSVLFGLLAGVVAAMAGVMSFDAVPPGAMLRVPSVFPFGVSEIRSGRAIPLLNVISMAEATGQTIAIAEAVGKDIDVRTEVPKTIRGECHRLADWRLPRHLRANVAVCFLIGELLSPRLADGNRSADAVAGRGGGAAVSRLGV